MWLSDQNDDPGLEASHHGRCSQCPRVRAFCREQRESAPATAWHLSLASSAVLAQLYWDDEIALELVSAIVRSCRKRLHLTVCVNLLVLHGLMIERLVRLESGQLGGRQPVGSISVSAMLA